MSTQPSQRTDRERDPFADPEVVDPDDRNEAPHEYLTDDFGELDLPDNIPRAHLPLNGPREWWCKTCRARVTVGTDGRTVYGHSRGCPHGNVANWARTTTGGLVVDAETFQAKNGGASP